MVCNYGGKIYNGTDEKWYFTRAIQNECPAAQLPRLCETDITYWYALFLFFEVCNNNRIYIAGGRRQRKAEKIDSRSQRAAIIEKCKEFKKKKVQSCTQMRNSLYTLFESTKSVDTHFTFCYKALITWPTPNRSESYLSLIFNSSFILFNCFFLIALNPVE